MTDKKFNIIIQARMSSSRFPGKSMMDLCGKPVLWHIVERCEKSATQNVIVATSTHASDDLIEQKCKEWDVACVRGEIDNVLSRFVKTSEAYPSKIIVRITGDCPLVEPEIIDSVVEQLKDADYASNVLERNIPHGLDVEAFTQQALLRAEQEADTDRYKEHVTLVMRENPNNNFKTKIAPMVDAYCHPELRLTLDTEKDFTLIETVYKHFKKATFFSAKEVIDWLLKHPNIASINSDVQQKTLKE